MVELTRRDALAALAAVGATAQGGCMGTPTADAPDPSVGTETDEEDPRQFDRERTLSTLTAAAEVLYPGDVEGHREFVETYGLGRIDGRPEYWAGVREASEALDDLARAWYDSSFEASSAATRESVLEQAGVDTADPDPDGTRTQQIRYYVVEELLYAFYASPPGGRLIGIENPVGYPGGTQSYTRGPQS